MDTEHVEKVGSTVGAARMKLFRFSSIGNDKL